MTPHIASDASTMPACGVGGKHYRKLTSAKMLS